jgi:hypothetical protein
MVFGCPARCPRSNLADILTAERVAPASDKLRFDLVCRTGKEALYRPALRRRFIARNSLIALSERPLPSRIDRIANGTGQA